MITEAWMSGFGVEQGGVLMVSEAHTGVDNQRECEGRLQGWRWPGN